MINRQRGYIISLLILLNDVMLSICSAEQRKARLSIWKKNLEPTKPNFSYDSSWNFVLTIFMHNL